MVAALLALVGLYRADLPALVTLTLILLALPLVIVGAVNLCRESSQELLLDHVNGSLALAPQGPQGPLLPVTGWRRPLPLLVFYFRGAESCECIRVWPDSMDPESLRRLRVLTTRHQGFTKIS
ncbi:hypothetical protein HBA55_27165 [Pseudomaricurvus alkylphenolicus]|nr:hypothetical protein [Pseudomaricurvus alkylphenolicus]